MKFSVLSGAYKNAGDFLIVDRSVKLLRYVYPNCEIQMYERRWPLDEHLDTINQSDALILAGGPAYSRKIYPNVIPLVTDLSKICVPIYTIGLGWYGRESTDSFLYQQYIFTEETKHFFSRIEQDGALACRDWYSMRALKNNGFACAVMTGCPAWYDLERVQRADLRDSFQFPYQKICFSDPAKIRNIAQSLEIVRYIRRRYPSAKLTYVFHRGIHTDSMTSHEDAEQYEKLARQLMEMEIEVRDIAYSKDGFSIYDDCDLHIGMRVHAHIYNLSIRNVSILIEEDGRGAGVNEALGLFRIKAYQSSEYSQGFQSENSFLIRRLDDYLWMLERDHFQIIKNSFRCQQGYFEKMISHLSTFQK